MTCTKCSLRPAWWKGVFTPKWQSNSWSALTPRFPEESELRIKNWKENAQLLSNLPIDQWNLWSYFDWSVMLCSSRNLQCHVSPRWPVDSMKVVTTSCLELDFIHKPLQEKDNNQGSYLLEKTMAVWVLWLKTCRTYALLPQIFFFKDKYLLD